jgi:hypothetical protein
MFISIPGALRFLVHRKSFVTPSRISVLSTIKPIKWNIYLPLNGSDFLFYVFL